VGEHVVIRNSLAGPAIGYLVVSVTYVIYAYANTGSTKVRLIRL
jgi:hypothetical protein